MCAQTTTLALAPTLDLALDLDLTPDLSESLWLNKRISERSETAVDLVGDYKSPLLDCGHAHIGSFLHGRNQSSLL